MVDIEKIEKRTVQSFYEDGLFEIALGLVFLLLGGYFFLQAVVPEDSAFGSVLSVLFIVVIFFAVFFVNRLVRFLKRRITYPRTGYVAFKKKEPSPRRRIATAVVAGIIGASMAALYSLSPSVKVLLPAVNGLLLAVAVLLFANKVGLIRYYLLAAASVVIGFAVTAAGIGDIKGVSLYYGIFGGAAVLSGLATLVVYLRRSPQPAAESPEGPMPANVRLLADIDKVIHEPARLGLTAILSVVESADFLYLQRETGLTKGNLSSHLAKLEEAGYVAIEKTYRGRVPLTLVRLTDAGTAAYKAYRARFKKFLERS